MTLVKDKIMKKFKNLGLLFVVLIGISATTINNDKLYEISKNIEIFVNVYKELNANYVDDLDPNQLMRIGIDAMVNSLDPYTNYISEAQVESYRISTDGKYEGMGALVRKVDEYVTIVEVYENSAATEAGLLAGDQIIAIEGKSTKNKSRADVTTFFRGVPGTKVRLKIKRPNVPEFDVDLTRGEVTIPNVPYSGFVADDIGYVALTTFTPNAGKNIRKAIRELKNENNNIKGLILDLRSNGGGLLKEAISVSNIFIPQNVECVSVRSKVIERDESYKTMATPLDLEIPLVVLINKTSASASEIVSGVIQDYDRGVLMGQRSYGKGLVQNTKDVGYNSRVKLTTSKYYIPSGRCIQSVEYENGEPVDIPDDKRSKFKTKAGRTVLDGGGVSPDVVLVKNPNPEILDSLRSNNIIFKYVTETVAKMDTSQKELEEIVFTDFEDFKKFSADLGFEFNSKNQNLLKELKANFEKTDKKDLALDISQIDSKITASNKEAIDKYKKIIIDDIEVEIATRKHFQKGKVFQKLKNDSEIVAAVNLLNDESKYNSLIKNN